MEWKMCITFAFDMFSNDHEYILLEYAKEVGFNLTKKM